MFSSILPISVFLLTLRYLHRWDKSVCSKVVLWLSRPLQRALILIWPESQLPVLFICCSSDSLLPSWECLPSLSKTVALLLRRGGTITTLSWMMDELSDWSASWRWHSPLCSLCTYLWSGWSSTHDSLILWLKVFILLPSDSVHSLCPVVPCPNKAQSPAQISLHMAHFTAPV